MRRSHGSPPFDDFRQLLTSRPARVIVKTMDMRLRKFLAVLLAVAVLFTLPLFTGATGVRAASDEIKVEVDTSDGGAVARWSPVEGASYYILSAGGSSLEVRDLTADIARLLPGGGHYTLTVTADTGETGSAEFDFFIALPSPTDLFYSDGILSWDGGSAPDGTIFAVTLNGVPVAETTQSSLALAGMLAGGSFTASVTALPATDSSGYVLSSSPAVLSFSHPSPLLPPANIVCLLSEDGIYLAWSAAEGAEKYALSVTAGGGSHAFETSALYLDLTDIISQNEEFTVTICSVNGGLYGLERTLVLSCAKEERA